jgi:hypothetical protein
MNPYQPPSAAADVPMSSPTAIQPFTVGRAIAQGFSLYFSNLPLIAGVTLVVFTPVELIKSYLLHAAGQEDNTMLTIRVEGLLESVFGALVAAALLPALAHKIETGRDLGLRAALGGGLRRWSAVFAARFSAGLRIVVGFFLLVIPGLVLTVRYALTDEVAALEHARSAKRTLGRSQDLVQGYAWRIVAVGFVAFLPVIAVSVADGFVTALNGSWIVAALADCVNDVAYRFLLVQMLVIYLALAREKAPEEVSSGRPVGAA